MQDLIEAIFNLGILTAEYVGGNWSDTKTMAICALSPTAKPRCLQSERSQAYGAKGKGPRELACQRGPS